MKTKTNELALELPSGRAAAVNGVKSLSGNRFVEISFAGKLGYAPYKLFVTKKVEAREHLAGQDVTIIANADWNAIVSAVEGITRFKKHPLIEMPGWSGSCFATKDGTCFAPPDKKAGKAIFPQLPKSDVTKGDLASWHSEIGGPIAGQHLLMVAVFAALAAPLVDIAGEPLNFGFELSGPPETGKTTWLTLFASIAGRPSRIPTFNSTKAGFEAMFNEIRDQPFPVDEANLADDSDKLFMKDFAFRMSNGVPKVTAFQPERAQFRFVYATTANQPFYEALGIGNVDTSGAALQRLLPLRIDRSNPLGIFTFVPDGFSSPGDFATYLADKIAAQYGAPMKSFLAELASARGKDAKALASHVKAKISEFEVKTGLSAASRGKTRATSAFGLLYAAGSMAKKKGILPSSWDCMEACVAAYRNYQSCLPDQTPLATRLLTIAQRPETLDLRDGSVPALTDAQLNYHGAFIKRGKGGRVELLLTEGVKCQFFPAWKELKLTSEFRASNVSAKDHDGQQRQVRQGKKKERFICFVLPSEIVDQLPQALLPTR